jgi:hypothetical protein
MKICIKCGLTKKMLCFGKYSASKDGHRSICKNCRNQDNKKHYQKHRMEYSLRGKKWYSKNKEKRKEYRLKYKKRMKIYQKAYYQMYKEQYRKHNKKYYRQHEKRIKALSRKYRRENHQRCSLRDREYGRKYRRIHSDELKKKRREYRRIHLDELRKKNKKYRKENPYKAMLHDNRRHELVKNAEGYFDFQDIQKIKVKQSNLCYYCNVLLKNGGTIDHKISLSRGGTNWPKNLCLACKPCNSRKHTKTDVEFINFLKGEKSGK